MESPTHYTRGSIEVWDFIRDQGLNYHRGNAIKYICRAGYKSIATETQDIKKAIHYLENELKYLDSLSESVSIRPSNTVPISIRNPEFTGQPDYATGFDR